MRRTRALIVLAALAALVVGCGDDDAPAAVQGPATSGDAGDTSSSTGAAADAALRLDGGLTATDEGIQVDVTLTNTGDEALYVVERFVNPEEAEVRYLDDGEGSVRLLRTLTGPIPGTAFDQQPTAEAVRLEPGASVERTGSYPAPTDPAAGPWLGEPAASADEVTFCIGSFPVSAYPDATEADGPDGPVVTLDDYADGPAQSLACSDPAALP
ncbi:MAG: hypothetical protein ACR2JF_08575 [Iamia sp.]